MNRREVVAGGAALVAVSPALASVERSPEPELMAAYRRWQAARADWKVVSDRYGALEEALFADARARFGPPPGPYGRLSAEEMAWCKAEKVRRGINKVEAEESRLLTLEDQALQAFYDAPAYTAAGMLLKIETAETFRDFDEVWPGIVADLERMVGRAS